MYSMISFLSQMWFPEVITSAPCSRKVRAMSGVTPKPEAEFSTLTTAKSASCCFLSLGRSIWTARRPGSPNTSPTQIMVSGLVIDLTWGGAAPLLPQSPPPHCATVGRAWQPAGDSSLRHLDRAGLADHHDLDVAGVLHLGLDALGDVLRQLVRVEVRDDVGPRHHAQLAPGLDRVAHVDALVGERDLFELGQPLDVGLEHVAPRARPRRRDPVGGLGEHRLHRLRLHVLVAAERGVDDLRTLAVLRQDLKTELGVAALLLVRERLADVVQQPHALGQL